MNTLSKQELITSLGRQIRLARTHHRREIKQVASDLMISPQAYSNIENGKTDLSVTRLLLIAQSIGVSPVELLAPLLTLDTKPKFNIQHKLKKVEKDIQELIREIDL